MSSEREIEVLLNAAYPILCIFSYEERRVEAAIASILNRRNKQQGGNVPLYYWSCTEGLVSLQGDTVTQGINNPSEILKKIGSDKSAGVFILRDFHEFMCGNNSVGLVRKLKDLAYFLSNHGEQRHVIIVGHHFEIPTALEKIITVVDFELPGDKEIRGIIKESLTAVGFERQWKELEKNTDELESLVKGAKGLTRFEIENVFAKSLVSSGGTLDIKVILGEKKHIIRKSGVLEFYEPSRDMNSVGGLDNLKSWLSLRGNAFSNRAAEYGLPTPKGVLIIGIPGTGKSLISKAVGIAWKMPVLRMDVGALFGSYVGQSEANMRKALKTAEALAPCILWIDEIEKGLGNARGGSDGGTTSRVFGSFLSWMQEKTEQVFVVATANNVAQLPPEMLRKGRFDEMFFCDLPDLEDRKSIFKIHLSKVGRDASKFDLEKLATAADTFSGAEIEQAIVDGLFTSFSQERELEDKDVLNAISVTTPLAKTMGEEIKEMREWAKSRTRPSGTVKHVEKPKRRAIRI